MTKKLTQHELSAAYPPMGPDEFQKMQDSIASSGVHETIVLFEGQVLDGWHRYQIASGFGMACPMREFGSRESDGDDPGQFVDDMNGRRRHNSIGQIALSEANVLRIMIRRGKTAPGAVVATVMANTGASQRTAERASVVSSHAIKEVQDAVQDGTVSLKKAEKIAKLPKSKQKKALTAPPAPAPWRAAPNAPLPRPEVGASKAALDELKERNAILAEEVDRLNDRLAVVATDATDEEKLLYSATLADLRAEVASLEVKLKAVTDSRDSAVSENNELRRQCAMQRNQLAKYRN